MFPILAQAPPANAPIYAYGFMLGLAIAVGLNLAIYVGWREGVPLVEMVKGTVLVALAAVLGSRVLHVLTLPGWAERPGEWFDLSGGIVAYGGFLGGTLAAYLFFGLRGWGFLRAADIMSPSVALGIAVTRVGCFLAGCDFGTPTTLPWGVRFPRAAAFDTTIGAWRESPAWREHYRGGISLGGETVTAGSAWSLPVHPTQLYEAAAGLLLFAVLIGMRKRKRFQGELFLLLAVLYGVARSAIEVFRGDAGRGAVAALSTSQFIGLTTAVLAFVCWARWRPAARTAAPVTGVLAGP